MTEEIPSRIAVILPRRERFSHYGAGAVSTVVNSFLQNSLLSPLIRVFGSPVESVLSEQTFVPVKLSPFWHGSKTRRYLHSISNLIDGERNFSLIEIHNRPKYVHFLRKRFPGIPLALYLHNDPRTMEGAKTPSERKFLLKQLHAIICVSDYIRSCFLDGINEGEEKIFTVRNAVNISDFGSVSFDQRSRELIFFGRTIPDKGLHLVVEAAEKVLKEFKEWKLVVIGSRYFDSNKIEPYEQELFCRVECLGKQGEVTGILTRKEVIERLKRASIAVLPSLWDEPIQLASMEAAACGCAVVTTKRGGIPEGMGNAAIYLPEETAEAIEKVLRWLICDNAALRNWQLKARDHAVKNCDIRIAAKKLDDMRRRFLEK